MAEGLRHTHGLFGHCCDRTSHGHGFFLDVMALVLVVSTMMFATLDVIDNKMLIADESLLSMLFYSALGTAVFSAPFALWNWKTPLLTEIFYWALSGVGAC